MSQGYETPFQQTKMTQWSDWRCEHCLFPLRLVLLQKHIGYRVDNEVIRLGARSGIFPAIQLVIKINDIPIDS